MLSRSAAPILFLAAVVARPATAQFTLPAGDRFVSSVHALTPRLEALNPLLAGHWEDPLSDVARNPALRAARGQAALFADGNVGAWALHAAGPSGTLGWSAALVVGPAEREDFSNLNQLLLGSPSRRTPSLGVPGALLPTDAARLETRAGLSARLAGGGRLGAALSYGTQPSTATFTTPSRQQDLDGNGWGVMLGWSKESGAGPRADVAGGWQDGTINHLHLVAPPGFSLPGLAHDRQRVAWGRVVVAGSGRCALSFVATLHRQMLDLERTETGFQGDRRADSIVRVSGAEAGMARQWSGESWRWSALAGLAYERARLTRRDSTSGSPFFPPTVTERTTKVTTWAPLAGVAGEWHVHGVFHVRGSTVVRAEREGAGEESRPSPSQPPPGQIIITFEPSPRQYRAVVDVRFGLGVTPPRSPLSFDLYLPMITEPQRWYAAAAYRF